MNKIGNLLVKKYETELRSIIRDTCLKGSDTILYPLATIKVDKIDIVDVLRHYEPGSIYIFNNPKEQGLDYSLPILENPYRLRLN
jgi:hypothetical protein